jgi:CBS domain-containing protein
LRLLVVVDDRNVVVGMLTRKDLIGAPRGTGGAGTGGGGGRGRVGEILNAAVDVAAREALDLDASGGDEIFVGAGNL